MALVIKRDFGGAPIQSFVPVPAQCDVPAVINAGATLTVLRSSDGDSAIQFRSVGGAVDVYFNDDTTKVMTFDGDQIWTFVLDDTVLKTNFKNNGAGGVTLQRWGQ